MPIKCGNEEFVFQFFSSLAQRTHVRQQRVFARVHDAEDSKKIGSRTLCYQVITRHHVPLEIESVNTINFMVIFYKFYPPLAIIITKHWILYPHFACVANSVRSKIIFRLCNAFKSFFFLFNLEFCENVV